jgi:GxxExxY protein
MHETKYLHSETTELIIKAFYKVYNTLGFGFPEKVYEKAMMIELKKMNLESISQQKVIVYYEGENVGDYFADILVVDKVILELKAVDGIHQKHITQLMNYLRATNIEVGLVLNFGPEAEIKKRVFTNDYKKSLPLNWQGENTLLEQH